MDQNQPKQVPLSEQWLSLKGKTIDDVQVTEDDDEVLHVKLSLSKRSELEPENDMAIEYSFWSFLFPQPPYPPYPVTIEWAKDE